MFQRTVDDLAQVDVFTCDGLVLEIPYTDGRKYTFSIKDTVTPGDMHDWATVRQATI